MSDKCYVVCTEGNAIVGISPTLEEAMTLRSLYAQKILKENYAVKNYSGIKDVKEIEKHLYIYDHNFYYGKITYDEVEPIW